MATITNVVGQTYTVNLKRNVQFTMDGVITETQEDLSIYLADTYRNTFSAGEVGGPLFGTTASGALTIVPAADSLMDHDDAYQAVAPFPKLVKRTRFIWASATNTLGWAWADEIRSISIGEPTRY